MTYDSKYSVTEVPTAWPGQQLQLSVDEEAGAVLLFVPDRPNPSHYHIVLTDEACHVMWTWLAQHLLARELIP